jgi:integrase/recombinase XerD
MLDILREAYRLPTAPCGSSANRKLACKTLGTLTRFFVPLIPNTLIQGKGRKDRCVLFPASFRGELAQYLRGPQERDAVYLLESNRLKPYSTRRIRQIVRQYAVSAGIEKRVYPHLFRHQIITFLIRKGIISPKLQLLSGHAEEKSLAIYRDLALADVSPEYQEAMRAFPVR